MDGNPFEQVTRRIDTQWKEGITAALLQLDVEPQIAALLVDSIRAKIMDARLEAYRESLEETDVEEESA